MSDYRQPKARELARIAWRQRVDEATRRYKAALRASRALRHQTGVTHAEWATRSAECFDALIGLGVAFFGPRPWRKPWTPADTGRCDCLRQGRECNDYCHLDGTCPECWNDPRGVRPHSDDGEGEGDECPTAHAYSIGDTGDYGWTCGCAFRKCPSRCGGTPPKEASARLRSKRRAAQRKRRMVR